jgi:hypothetical protein
MLSVNYVNIRWADIIVANENGWTFDIIAKSWLVWYAIKAHAMKTDGNPQLGWTGTITI